MESAAMQGGFDIENLRQEAKYRWLKPTEVFCILQNHEKIGVSQVVPDKPPSGSLLLFNKRVLRYFRKDGHEWRKKKDGRTVNEAHEHLKVGNLDAINCYYAHGEQNRDFQRRCFWLLDPACEHIVLVHYREVFEGRYTSGPSTSSDFYSTINDSSYFTDAVGEQFQSSQSSDSPLSIEEVSSTSKGINRLGCDNIDEKPANFAGTSNIEFDSALHQLEIHLSLDEDTVPINENTPKFFQSLGPDFQRESGLIGTNVEVVLKPNGTEIPLPGDIHPTASIAHAFDVLDSSFNISSLPSVTDKEQESFSIQQRGYGENNVKDTYNGIPDTGSTFELLLSEARKFISDFDEYMVPSTVQGIEGGYNGSTVITHESQNVNKGNCFDWSIAPISAANVNLYPSDISELIFNKDQDQDQDQSGTFVGDLSLTVADKQLFSIHEISPEQAFCSVTTKVIIVGDFLCDSSEYSWKAMFGDTEVPLEIVRNGVLRCWTPTKHLLGKVSFCVTSGNRIACSQLRDIEFIPKPESIPGDDQSEMGKTKVTEDLELLTRLAKILFCNLESKVLSKVGGLDSKDDPFLESVGQKNSWEHDGHTVHKNPLLSACWILQEILKGKLQDWLSDKCYGSLDAEKNTCPLSKQEQGIIHMISGLGYEWALKPLLDSGLGINFRDANGWTALHWAACFGREKMVSSLIAAGASPGAVTDPTSQDPVGRTPASLAAAGGHKGLAGYLSEVALTNHLLSLTIGESEMSQACAAMEAEKILERIHDKTILSRFCATEDHLSLQDSLTAVKNAAHAAARIQAAFRALSFKNRQLRASQMCQEYELTPDEIYGLSIAPRYHPYQKGSSGSSGQNLHGAALCIQKKYRGWKGRKNFLTLRKNVVKIQAHVRGYQIRKKYQLLWCVNVMEKVILRWRRRGVGLRGFRTGSEVMDETEEDILKIFRKQKVDAALDEAVNRVLSMIESPEARQQYRRLLDGYRRAKVEQMNAVDLRDEGELLENFDEEMQQFLSREDTWGSFP